MIKQNNTPIIIGGCGSSGTTLLASILNAHPNIAIGPEMSIFDRPLLYQIPYDQLKTMFRNDAFDLFDTNMFYPISTGNGTYCGFSSGNHGREYHNGIEIKKLLDEAKSVKEFVQLYFQRYAEKQGKKRWGEKTPGNIFYFKEIMDFFDNKAKFIHVIRDGRDVVNSLCTKRGYTMGEACYRWLLTVNHALSIHKMRSPNYWIIDYNYIINDPELEIRALCNFISEDFDKSMIANFKNMYPNGKDTINDDSVGTYRNWDQITTQRIQTVLGPTLKEFGYV